MRYSRRVCCQQLKIRLKARNPVEQTLTKRKLGDWTNIANSPVSTNIPNVSLFVTVQSNSKQSIQGFARPLTNGFLDEQ